MSAIFGVLRRCGAAVAERELEVMGALLSHRGPDGRQVLALDNAGLGHCLMRVNREDRFEAQPLYDSANGVTLVADIRLDNREALAEGCGITADALAQLSDSDVLLAAWRQWGDACLERLIGDFTIAVRDHRRKRLYLARDGMGQRGLYVFARDAVVAFASEVKPLFALTDVPRVLSETGIARRLLVPVDPDPEVTFYEGVAILPGGVVRWYDDVGGGGERRFWEPCAAPEHLGKDDAYYLAAYRRIVEEATACRVRRLEGPPCLMFSGGFDSGTIAAVAGPIVAQRGQAVIAVTSVLNEGEQSDQGDSRKLAEAFAGRTGVALHTVARGDASVFTGLEEGFARSGECFTLDYVRAAGFALGRREGARLAMDGHGGDYTVNMLDAGMLGRILLRGQVRRFWRELWARRAFTRRSFAAILYGDVLRPLVPQRLMRAFFDWRTARGPVWQRRFTRDDFAMSFVAGGPIDPGRLRHPRVAWQRWQERWMHLQRLQMLGPPAMATTAAAHGLDFTRPFHDIRIVELALAIPEHLQFRDGRERWLARTALADCLPASLVARPPGNTPERPGQEAMFAQSLPEALAVLEHDWADSPAARYVEISKLRTAIAEGESGPLGWRNPESTFGATNALAVARFVNWFYRGNGPAQEP